MNWTIERNRYPIYSYFQVEKVEQVGKVETRTPYTILCDSMGLSSVPRKEVEEFIEALRQGLDNISDAEFIESDKQTLLNSHPSQFPQLYGELDPLWQKYLLEHPPVNTTPEKRRMPKAVPGYVYIVKMGTYYKIGCSKNPSRRIAALGVKTPVSLDLCMRIQTSDMYTLEKELHTRFATVRADGEWFALTDEDLGNLAMEFPQGLDAERHGHASAGK